MSENTVRGMDAVGKAMTAQKVYFEHRPLNLKHIRPRRINFRFGDELPKLWLNDSLVMTHCFNSLNLYLPAFESFIVGVMQKQLPFIKEENLKQQIHGFIGQEMSHGQTHHKYNQVLRLQGYKFENYLKFTDFIFKEVMPKRLSFKVNLAAIAGFEHLTAIFTEIALNQHTLDNANPMMKDLWKWHAAEEVEHGSLALQLLQTVDNSYWLRILGGFIGLIIIGGFTFSGFLILASQEKGFISYRTVVDIYKLLLGEHKLILTSISIFLEYFKQDTFSPHRNLIPKAEKVFI